jgi:hypothetical protein
MNITFWFMEIVAVMNTSIFGENGASSRLTQLTARACTLSRKPARPETGAALADFVRGLRGR